MLIRNKDTRGIERESCIFYENFAESALKMVIKVNLLFRRRSLPHLLILNSTERGIFSSYCINLNQTNNIRPPTIALSPLLEWIQGCKFARKGPHRIVKLHPERLTSEEWEEWNFGRKKKEEESYNEPVAELNPVHPFYRVLQSKHHLELCQVWKLKHNNSAQRDGFNLWPMNWVLEASYPASQSVSFFILKLKASYSVPSFLNQF